MNVNLLSTGCALMLSTESAQNSATPCTSSDLPGAMDVPELLQPTLQHKFGKMTLTEWTQQAQLCVPACSITNKWFQAISHSLLVYWGHLAERFYYYVWCDLCFILSFPSFVTLRCKCSAVHRVSEGKSLQCKTFSNAFGFYSDAVRLNWSLLERKDSYNSHGKLPLQFH